MSKRNLLVIVAVLGLLASATPAHAAQLDPREAPQVSGGASDPGTACKRDVAKRGGRIAAVGRICTFAYFLDSSSETRSYLVLWQQTAVKARKGFCVKKVHADITRSPGNNRFETTTPTSRTAKRARTVTTKLVTTAGGTMPGPATFQQDYILRPNGITATTTTVGADERFRTEWKGSTRRAVAVVSAAEVSWNTLTGTPGVSAGADYTIRRQRSC